MRVSNKHKTTFFSTEVFANHVWEVPRALGAQLQQDPLSTRSRLPEHSSLPPPPKHPELFALCGPRKLLETPALPKRLCNHRSQSRWSTPIHQGSRMETGHQSHMSVRKEPEIRSWLSDWPVIQIQGTEHGILLDMPLQDKNTLRPLKY